MIEVLDKGFVRLVDSMGDDLSVVRAARVSYDAAWRAGEDKGSDTRLIRYLAANHHTTPFEAVEFQFEVKAPIFVARQWMRHRTWCLAGDAKVMFMLPNGRPHYVSIKNLCERWNAPERPVVRPDKQNRTRKEFNRQQIAEMNVYCIDERGNIATTKITDIWFSGVKAVYELKTRSGKSVKASEDHLFKTPCGWKKLADLKEGDLVLCLGRSASTERDLSAPDVDTSTEVWKNWSDTIEVSNFGRVKRHGKVIKISRGSGNRAIFSVKSETGWVTQQVSKAVADCFLSGSGVCLRHLNDNPMDNRVSNLAWGSQKQNHEDAKKNGRRATRNAVAEEIVSIRYSGVENTYDLSVLCSEHNFFANHICVHNSFNELSARYRELPSDFYVPEFAQITTQHPDNKQMRTDQENAFSKDIRDILATSNAASFACYDGLLGLGCPRELARTVLPVGTYTHFFAKVDLLNLIKFLKLRDHEHAQFEIREYAKALAVLAKKVAPVSLEGWGI